jgi:hypothetical protein
VSSENWYSGMTVAKVGITMTAAFNRIALWHEAFRRDAPYRVPCNAPIVGRAGPVAVIRLAYGDVSVRACTTGTGSQFTPTGRGTGATWRRSQWGAPRAIRWSDGAGKRLLHERTRTFAREGMRLCGCRSTITGGSEYHDEMVNSL